MASRNDQPEVCHKLVAATSEPLPRVGAVDVAKRSRHPTALHWVMQMRLTPVLAVSVWDPDCHICEGDAQKNEPAIEIQIEIPGACHSFGGTCM